MILFLDFDGVLHPVGSSPQDYFCRLPLLQRFLLEEAGGWRIVISSSWREYFEVDELKSHFAQELRPRILGATPPSDDRRLRAVWGAQAQLFPREVEIRQYLSVRHPQARDWLALDDHAEWFRDARTNPNLVLTDPSQGVTGETIARLRQFKTQVL